MVKLFYENRLLVKKVALQLRLGLDNRPSESTVNRIAQKCKGTGSVVDKSENYICGGRLQKSIDYIIKVLLKIQKCP